LFSVFHVPSRKIAIRFITRLWQALRKPLHLGCHD
jgi:hypothetical protein